MSPSSGVVKLSPGHSAVDWEASRRLGLPALNMLDDNGRVTEIGGEFVVSQLSPRTFQFTPVCDSTVEYVSVSETNNFHGLCESNCRHFFLVLEKNFNLIRS